MRISDWSSDVCSSDLCAGVLPSGERFGSVDANTLAETLATNTIGPFALAQAVAPMLVKGHAPRIANLSSVLGSIARNEAFRTHSYAMSKSALNMATVLLARALAESVVPGVGRVSCRERVCRYV